MMMNKLIFTATLLFSSGAFASGSATCQSTQAADKLSISWGTMHGIGNPRIGHFRIDWNGKKYALGIEAKKTEVGTTVIPMQVVGYWVEHDRLLLKVTDDQVMDTLIHIDAILTKVGSENELRGDAYFKLTKSDPSRKMAIRCTIE